MKIENNILLFKLIRRTIIFLGLLVFTQMLIFLMGNYQGFLDRNQNMILSLSCICSLALSFFCLLAVILTAVIFFKQRKKTIFIQTFIYALIMILASGISFFTRTVSYLSYGMELSQ